MQFFFNLYLTRRILYKYTVKRNVKNQLCGFFFMSSLDDVRATTYMDAGTRELLQANQFDISLIPDTSMSMDPSLPLVLADVFRSVS